MYRYSKLFALFALLSLSLCNAASFYPTSLQTQKGSASNQALSVLQTQDQTANQDTWANYIEFDGSSVAYKGVFTFDVSSLIDSVSAYTVNVNFKGPKSTTQLWQFEWSQPAAQTWDLAGDNKAASSWKWSPLSFDGSLPFSTLVSNGQVQLRLSSKKSGDNCDIDFLELVVSTDSVVTPTTTPAATPTPTSTPTATPTPTSTPTATPKPTSTPTATPKPTSTPTATPKPTSTPTATPKPTSTPTATPKPTTTPAPTNAPSTGGRICPAGQIWSPAPGTTWQWQLTGTVDQSFNVQMYDIDLFDASTALIGQLHDKGRVVICYFSTQYENWRPDASAFTASVLGSNLDDWPGERYVDIRSPIVRAIMTARMDLAVSKGCDGIEPDNVDGYTNKNGFSLTAANQLEYNKFLAQQAHARGLSIGLKNDLDQVSQLVTYFDWALNEQCNQYGECGSLTPFVTAGKAVFGTEYSGSASSFCSKMNTQKFSWLLKDLDLGVKVTQCCSSAAGGCTPAAYKCVASSQRRSEYAEAFAPDAELEAIEAALAPSPFEEEVAKSE